MTQQGPALGSVTPTLLRWAGSSNPRPRTLDRPSGQDSPSGYEPPFDGRSDGAGCHECLHAAKSLNDFDSGALATRSPSRRRPSASAGRSISRRCGSSPLPPAASLTAPGSSRPCVRRPPPDRGGLSRLPADPAVAAADVPHESVRVTRARRLARSPDGGTHLWASRRESVGGGEGSSGLRFDVVEHRTGP